MLNEHITINGETCEVIKKIEDVKEGDFLGGMGWKDWNKLRVIDVAHVLTPYGE